MTSEFAERGITGHEQSGHEPAEQLSARMLQIEPRLEFEPVSMSIMGQYDKATFAQVPLRLTGNPDLPVEVDPDQRDLYKVGSGRIWQVGKKLLGAAIPTATATASPSTPAPRGPPWRQASTS